MCIWENFTGGHPSQHYLKACTLDFRISRDGFLKRKVHFVDLSNHFNTYKFILTHTQIWSYYKIYKEKCRGILGLFENIYINKVLKKFWMKDCSPSVAPIMTGDKLWLDWINGKKIPYVWAIGSLMYAQVCTRHDITCTIGVLGRCQNNSGIDHWKGVKIVMRYLQGTNDHMLVYKWTNNMEVIGYTNVDYASYMDSCKSTSWYVLILAGKANSWRNIYNVDLDCHLHVGGRVEVFFEATLHGVRFQSFIFELKIINSIPWPLRLHCYDWVGVLMVKLGI